MGGWRAWIERLVAWDAAVAADTLASFEAHTGLRSGDRDEAPVVQAADVPTILAALRGGVPVVEHHWATWCDGCVEEMPHLAELSRRLEGKARVLTVSWDRFDTALPLQGSLDAVRATLMTHGAAVTSLVCTDPPEALFAALRLPIEQIPQTRVRDADGGVLRAWPGPIDAADVEEIVRLLTT